MAKIGRVDESWCEAYTHACIREKTGTTPKGQLYADTLQAIKEAFGTVYRAIAFDIDGTLTMKSSHVIDSEMAQIVGRLLLRSVPVLLITGRGRRSSRDAVADICSAAHLSVWYARRIQCITHNGVFLLRTPTDKPDILLSEEQPLTDAIEDIPKLCDQLKHALRNRFPEDAIGVTREPRSIRIKVMLPGLRKKIESEVQRILSGSQKRSTRLYLSRGSYAGFDCFDIATTTKLKALSLYAKSLGITPDRILRVGDQGKEGGNDYDLLKSVHAFSVDEFSKSPYLCHPVISDCFRHCLKGAEATKTLLKRVMLFPPLSIAPTPANVRLSALRAFEKLALSRSRQETETVEQRLRVRLHHVLPDRDANLPNHSLHINDIIDPRSGAIRFRDWELDGLRHDHPVRELFGLTNMETQQNGLPRLRWCMYSDTGILMRGPCYYYAMTHKGNELSIRSYVRTVENFLKGVSEILPALIREEPSLTLYKLVLAICDNVRNALIQMQYATFLAETMLPDQSYSVASRLFTEALAPHTRLHFDLLLNLDADWYELLCSYKKLIDKCRTILQEIAAAEAEGYMPCPGRRTPLRRWRECDNFIQNVAAIQLGLHQLRQRPDIRECKQLTVVGLVYGGTELPAIAHVVSEGQGYKVRVCLLNVSIYGDRETGRKIREGKTEYVENMLLKKKPLLIMGPTSSPSTSLDGSEVILLDDNCTTGVTLQLARDVLVLMGSDVLGAIVVRFPGVNRHVQMALPGHGFPDPEVMFGFIRGLVAPSPYARLVVPGTGTDVYLDQTGVFDKSRQRIERYLMKNGTPPY